MGEYVSITSGEAPSKFEEGTELYVKVDDLNYNDKYVVDTQNKVAEHSTVKRVTKGSIVFPKRGAAIMTNKVRILGIDSYMDTNMMALTSERLDSEFLYNIISKEGLYKIADTSTIPQINNKHIEPYEVKIPSLDEQRRIGVYFKQLDNLITLHQRKYNQLLNVKKSMLEKMFPKNGSNIPEIRFKGFTDPWEQRKVLDLLELLTDYDANGSFADMAKNINTTDGDGYAWYVRITDLENPKPLSELKYVDESSYEFLKKTELHGGELLMAKRGNIGKVYIFEPRTKYATVAPNMYLLKLNNKVIPHFLYDYFVSEEGNKKLTRLNASSTMGALYKDDVKNIDVIMPSIEEQAMIGNFFQSIDHIITLHQRLYF